MANSFTGFSLLELLTKPQLFICHTWGQKVCIRRKEKSEMQLKNEWTLAAVELTWHLYSVLFHICRMTAALCRCSKIKVTRLLWSPWDALSVYPHAGWSTSSWWLYDSCFFEQFARYLAETLESADKGVCFSSADQSSLLLCLVELAEADCSRHHEK